MASLGEHEKCDPLGRLVRSLLSGAEVEVEGLGWIRFHDRELQRRVGTIDPDAVWGSGVWTSAATISLGHFLRCLQ